MRTKYFLILSALMLINYKNKSNKRQTMRLRFCIVLAICTMNIAPSNEVILLQGKQTETNRQSVER